MRKAVLCLIAFVLLAAPAVAGDGAAWKRVADANDGETYSIDKKSIERLGGERFRVWVKLVFPAKSTSRVSEMASLVEVDCDNFTTRVVESRLLMRNGESVAFQTPDTGSSDEWKPFTSIEEEVYLPYCI